MTDEHYYKLEFVRNWRDDYCLGFLEIWTYKPLTKAQAFEAVKKALTQWIATTDSGRKAYGDYEEFNFGDLLNSEPWADGYFRRIARRYGVRRVAGTSLDVSGAEHDWDARLVDHEEIKSGWAAQGIEE